MNATRITPADKANRLLKRARLAASVLPLPRRIEVLLRFSRWLGRNVLSIDNV